MNTKPRWVYSILDGFYSILLCFVFVFFLVSRRTDLKIISRKWKRTTTVRLQSTDHTEATINRSRRCRICYLANLVSIKCLADWNRCDISDLCRYSKRSSFVIFCMQSFRDKCDTPKYVIFTLSFIFRLFEPPIRPFKWIICIAPEGLFFALIAQCEWFTHTNWLIWLLIVQIGIHDMHPVWRWYLFHFCLL